MFARSLSREIAECGGRSILCFPSAPQEAVKDFLSQPGTILDIEPLAFDSRLLVSTRAFDQLLKRHKPTILHLHFMGMVSPFPWLARRHGVEKIIFTDHSSKSETASTSRNSLLKGLAKRIIQYPIDRVVAVSEYSLRALHQLNGKSRKPFQVIYNGVDLERVAASTSAGHGFRERFSIPHDATLITQLSWMIPEKGASDLLEAVQIVVQTRPRAHFVFAGEGAFLDEYKQAARRAGIAAYCTFTGELRDPFSDGVLAASDIVCQPSRWQEAFCWVVAEAMAFGKPVVATAVGALREVVQDGVTGMLVPPRDSAALAARLLELISDKGLRERMGLAGSGLIADRFTLKRNVSQHLRLYGIQ